MKKTIAILLVLVIGMAGVFAGTYDSSKTINLEVTIDDLAALYITSAEQTTYSTSAPDEISNFDFVVEGPGLIENVGFVTVFSNLRSGYKLEYTANVMESGATDTRYIDYSVQIGNDANTLIKTDAYNTTPVLSGTKTINEVTSQTETNVFSEEISITIDDNFDTAVAGTYVGTIVFEFTAG
jgi:hypothetical protein